MSDAQCWISEMQLMWIDPVQGIRTMLSKEKLMQECYSKINDGVHPDEAIPEKELTKIAADEIQSISLEDNENVIEIVTVGSQANDMFVADTEHEAKVIAQQLSAAFNLTKTRCQLSVKEASFAPGVVFVMVAAAAGLLTFAAMSGGTDDSPRAGKAAMFRDLVRFLGPTGTMYAGIAAIALSIGWWAFVLIRRPEKTVYVKS